MFLSCQGSTVYPTGLIVWSNYLYSCFLMNLVVAGEVI